MGISFQFSFICTEYICILLQYMHIAANLLYRNLGVDLDLYPPKPLSWMESLTEVITSFHIDIKSH